MTLDLKRYMLFGNHQGSAMHRILISIVVFLVCATTGADPAPETRGKLDVKIERRPIAGMPILFQITVTNTEAPPFQYWFGGPGQYPPAHNFTATFVEKNGKRVELALSNGQAIGGSGGFRAIDPGKSAEIPATGGPLPAGNWTLDTLIKSKDWRSPAMMAKPALMVEVVDDSAGAAAFAADLLKRVRAGDSFARHVAARFKIAKVIDAMVQDLESPDGLVVRRAVESLRLLKTLPKGLGAVIKRSMLQQLGPKLEASQTAAALAQFAGREGSDDSLDAVIAHIKDARTQPHDAYYDRLLLQLLFNFKQPRAVEMLRAEGVEPPKH